MRETQVDDLLEWIEVVDRGQELFHMLPLPT